MNNQQAKYELTTRGWRALTFAKPDEANTLTTALASMQKYLGADTTYLKSQIHKGVKWNFADSLSVSQMYWANDGRTQMRLTPLPSATEKTEILTKIKESFLSIFKKGYSKA